MCGASPGKDGWLDVIRKGGRRFSTEAEVRSHNQGAAEEDLEV